MGWFTNKEKQERLERELKTKDIFYTGLQKCIEDFKDDMMFAETYTIADINVSDIILEFIKGSNIFSYQKTYPGSRMSVRFNLKEYNDIWTRIFNKEICFIFDINTDKQKMHTVILNTISLSHSIGGENQIFVEFEMNIKYNDRTDYSVGHHSPFYIGKLTVEYKSPNTEYLEKIRKLDSLFCGLTKEDIKNYLDDKL